MKRGANHSIRNRNHQSASDIAMEQNLTNVFVTMHNNKGKGFHPLSKHILFLILLSCSLIFKAIIVISLYCPGCFDSTENNNMPASKVKFAYTFNDETEVKKNNTFVYAHENFECFLKGKKLFGKYR